MEEENKSLYPQYEEKEEEKELQPLILEFIVNLGVVCRRG